MHIHILGICGTFMGGLALIARELGHEVTGSDAGCYPPMSTQLEQQGIGLFDGYSADNSSLNRIWLSSVMPCHGAMLNWKPCCSRGCVIPRAPSGWLMLYCMTAWVLAVAGTHGKTSTSSMLGLDTGVCRSVAGFPDRWRSRQFLDIGTVGISDFLSWRPMSMTPRFSTSVPSSSTTVRALVLNNLEFDHADIFPIWRRYRPSFTT